MCRIMGHLPGRRLWHLSRLVRRTDGEMRIGEELEIGSDQQLGRRLDHHFRVVHNCLQGLFGRGRSTMITPSCVSGRRRHPRLFWERLSYLFRDSTSKSGKSSADGNLWVPERFVDVILGKMGPGRARYGWYFRCHIPFLERVGRCLP